MRPYPEVELDRLLSRRRFVGEGLRRALGEAGLAHPRAILAARVEGGPDSLVYAELAAVTRGLLGDMERTGVAAHREVAVDTLAARLWEEVVSAGATVTSPHFIGAWGVSS